MPNPTIVTDIEHAYSLYQLATKPHYATWYAERDGATTDTSFRAAVERLDAALATVRQRYQVTIIEPTADDYLTHPWLKVTA